MSESGETPWPTGERLLREIDSADVRAGALAFWHIGQSGFVVKGGSETLVFDPFLQPSNERLSRTWEPPFQPEQLQNVSLLFCSHDHLDHLDPVAVKGITSASPAAQLVVPTSAVERARQLGVAPERIVGIEVDAPRRLGRVTVRAVPAAHGDKADPIAECVWEPDPERGFRFIGFVVAINGVTVYHAGDSTIYPGMVERLESLGIDVALLPINGRDWFRERHGIIGNMDHREAADLGNAIHADVIVPIHYDMFAGNLGHPGWFVDYCQSRYPQQGVHVPSRCRRWTYVKQG